MENNYNIISENDLNTISTLNNRIPLIKQKYDLYQYDLESCRNITDFKKKIYKENKESSEIINAFKDLCQEALSISTKEYNDELDNWNIEMNKFIQKYNYVKLRDFLKNNPLETFESRPTLMFAVNTKKIAEHMNIPILQLLLSGKPRFVNSYPRVWLGKVYKKIEELTLKNPNGIPGL